MSVTYSGDGITFNDGSSIASGWTGFKNRVINGGMRIDQRNSGNSVSAVGNASAYPVDRTFVCNYTNQSGNTTVTGQRVSVAENIGFDYAIRATVGNTASRGSNYDARFQHNFEGNMVADYVFGTTTMTASFWARASKSGYAYYTIWASNTGSGAYFYKRISLTTSWQKFTVQIPVCNIAGAAIYRDNQRGFGSGLYWATTGWSAGTEGQWLTAAQLPNNTQDDFSSSGDWIEFTGYQLEFGNTATSFDWRPYSTELALCQRYFEIQYIQQMCGYRPNAAGSGNIQVGLQYITKRTAPSITFTSPATLDGATVTMTATEQTVTHSRAYSSGSYAGGTTCEFDCVNGVKYDAEL